MYASRCLTSLQHAWLAYLSEPLRSPLSALMPRRAKRLGFCENTMKSKCKAYLESQCHVKYKYFVTNIDLFQLLLFCEVKLFIRIESRELTLQYILTVLDRNVQNKL